MFSKISEIIASRYVKLRDHVTAIADVNETMSDVMGAVEAVNETCTTNQKNLIVLMDALRKINDRVAELEKEIEANRVLH